MNNLLENLHQYCDKLFFEIGGAPGEDQELIITAEGNIKFFDQVEKLINSAPAIAGWIFIPFIPARTLNYVSVFEGVELKPSEIWFLPLENKNEPKAIAFMICLPNYESVKNNEWLNEAVYKMLDAALGEKVFALDINYIEVKGLPEGNLEEKGLIELKDMAPVLKWKKAKVALL